MSSQCHPALVVARKRLGAENGGVTHQRWPLLITCHSSGLGGPLSLGGCVLWGWGTALGSPHFTGLHQLGVARGLLPQEKGCLHQKGGGRRTASRALWSLPQLGPGFVTLSTGAWPQVCDEQACLQVRPSRLDVRSCQVCGVSPRAPSSQLTVTQGPLSGLQVEKPRIREEMGPFSGGTRLQPGTCQLPRPASAPTRSLCSPVSKAQPPRLSKHCWQDSNQSKQGSCLSSLLPTAPLTEKLLKLPPGTLASPALSKRRDPETTRNALRGGRPHTGTSDCPPALPSGPHSQAVCAHRAPFSGSASRPGPPWPWLPVAARWAVPFQSAPTGRFLGSVLTFSPDHLLGNGEKRPWALVPSGLRGPRSCVNTLPL